MPFEDIIEPDATVELIASGFSFTEGPAWSPDGILVFSDLDENRIIRLNEDGTTEDCLNPSGAANGLVFDADGALYICQGGARSDGAYYACTDMCRRVSRLAGEGTLGVLADSYNSLPFNSRMTWLWTVPAASILPIHATVVIQMCRMLEESTMLMSRARPAG